MRLGMLGNSGDPKIFARSETKYLEFSSEAFNMALSEPGRRVTDLSWQKKFDRLNKCSN
jgi:hypothetical protein